MPRVIVKWISLCLLLAPLITACGQPPLSPEPLTLQAVSLKGDPQIVFSTTFDQVLVDVTSPTGIGSAVIEKTAGQWPDKIVLRFHLAGLEHLAFQYGATTIEVSVSSHAGSAVTESVVKDGTTTELSPGSLLSAQYWMPVRIFKADGTTGTAPVPGGTIEVTVPPDFFRSQETKFTLEWIDFYR